MQGTIEDLGLECDFKKINTKRWPWFQMILQWIPDFGCSNRDLSFLALKLGMKHGLETDNLFILFCKKYK